MYLALYLTPWIVVYALSSMAFNHLGALREWHGGNLNEFETVREMEYINPFPPGTTPENAARLILLDLDMDGTHFIRGELSGERFTVLRQLPYAVRRITYFPNEGRLTVERQKANLPSFLTRLHTRHGYEHDYPSAKLWGLAVELTILAMLFWIGSGIWMWWEIKPARLWGGACLAGGFALFAVLFLTL